MRLCASGSSMDGDRDIIGLHAELGISAHVIRQNFQVCFSALGVRERATSDVVAGHDEVFVKVPEKQWRVLEIWLLIFFH